MSKSNAFENDLLKLIFNGDAIADIAQNDTSGPLTEFWLSLHTADPGEAGNQETNEVVYAEYERISVARTSGGWTVTGNSVTPVNAVEFPEAGSGASETATHAAIGTAQTGTGKILFSGALTPNIPIVENATPRIKNTSTITED